MFPKAKRLRSSRYQFGKLSDIHQQSANENRVLPIAPEFCEWLELTPPAQRHGYVFNSIPQYKDKSRSGSQTVGRTISKIGEKAGVIVDWKQPKPTAEDQERTPVFTWAHDLRRSFGERWGSRIKPKELMELMRHKSIDTTMRFYLGQNATRTASILWAAHRDIVQPVGTTSKNETPEPTKTAENSGV